MDLSPGQQKAVFALVVVVLAALGYWLVVPKLTHHVPAAAPSRAASSPLSGPATLPATLPATPPQASTVPSASPASPGAVNIYSWLPFTQQGLAAAAAVTVKFCDAYNTYSYTEDAASYVGSMNGLITAQLATSLRAVYDTPGVAKTRTSQKQVSTATAVINSLRSFGPSSLTFLVTAAQHLVTSNGASNGSTQYAITVTGSGASWQASNIQLASVGQS